MKSNLASMALALAIAGAANVGPTSRNWSAAPRPRLRHDQMMRKVRNRRRNRIARQSRKRNRA